MFHVACPACGAKARAPAHYAGATVRCKKCGVQMILPGIPPPEPPVRSVTPPAVDDEPPGEDSLDQIGEMAAGPRVPPEPWYYGFLQTMTHIFLWLNVAGVVLGLLGWVLWIILVLVGAASMAGSRDAEGAGRAMAGAGVLFFLVASLPYLVGLIVWLLVALMTAGWSFLALDAARNLRVLRYAPRH